MISARHSLLCPLWFSMAQHYVTGEHPLHHHKTALAHFAPLFADMARLPRQTNNAPHRAGCQRCHRAWAGRPGCASYLSRSYAASLPRLSTCCCRACLACRGMAFRTGAAFLSHAAYRRRLLPVCYILLCIYFLLTTLLPSKLHLLYCAASACDYTLAACSVFLASACTPSARFRCAFTTTLRVLRAGAHFALIACRASTSTVADMCWTAK